jgi:hypothetical protein
VNLIVANDSNILLSIAAVGEELHRAILLPLVSCLSKYGAKRSKTSAAHTTTNNNLIAMLSASAFNFVVVVFFFFYVNVGRLDTRICERSSQIVDFRKGY